jgi:hypothetical protein
MAVYGLNFYSGSIETAGDPSCFQGATRQKKGKTPFFFSSGGAGNQTQGFALARQVLCHLPWLQPKVAFLNKKSHSKLLAWN